MERCVFCRGELDPFTGRCRQCQRLQPTTLASGFQPDRRETPETLHQAPGTERAARRFSRRNVLLGLTGLAGLGVAGGILGRLASVLARNRTIYTYHGHTQEIEALAWSPDSQRLASGAENLQIWDALSGGHLQTFPDPVGIESIAWSPNGTYLASGSWDRTVSVWEVATGKKLLTYYGHGQVYHGAFASSQAFSVAEMPSEMRGLMPYWPSSARALGITGLAWSPDGTRLLSTGGDLTAQVWEALTGQALLTFGSMLDPYGDADWSPDGQHLLMHTVRGIQVHDAILGKLLFTFPIGNEYELLSGPSSWSPNGNYVASTNFQVIHLWELATGRKVLTYQGHSDTVVVVAWASDGKRLASAGFDLTVRVWEATNGQTDFIYRGHLGLLQQFFSETAPTLPAQVPQVVRVVAASHQGVLASSANALLPQDEGSPPPRIAALAWAPNGRYIASGGSDTTVQVWQPG